MERRGGVWKVWKGGWVGFFCDGVFKSPSRFLSSSSSPSLFFIDLILIISIFKISLSLPRQKSLLDLEGWVGRDLGIAGCNPCAE